MKIKFLLFAIAIANILFAQNTGKGFSYQALARDAMGNIRANENIELRFSLLPDQFSETPDYQETQVATTDAFGTFAVIIGRGIKTAGAVESFADISFRYTNYWLKIEIKESNDYINLITQQLLSVPYAENTFEMPAGVVIPFAGPKEKIPQGWLLCDGTALSKDDYPKLYDAIGTAWGNGTDGTGTNFNLPDMRGMFLRGVADVAGSYIDPNVTTREPRKTGQNSGNKVGSYQQDAFQNFTGTFSFTDNNATYMALRVKEASGAFSFTNSTLSHVNSTDVPSKVSLPNQITFDASRVARTSTETRPKNVYVNYIIKY